MSNFNEVFGEGKDPLLLYKCKGRKATDGFPAKRCQLYAYDEWATLGEQTTQTNFFDEENRGEEAMRQRIHLRVTPRSTRIWRRSALKLKLTLRAKQLQLQQRQSSNCKTFSASM